MFRAGARLTDAAAVSRAIAVAVQGLETMQKYTSLGAGAWQVTLEQDPLNEAAYHQKRAEALAAEAAERRAAAAVAPPPR